MSIDKEANRWDMVDAARELSAHVTMAPGSWSDR